MSRRAAITGIGVVSPGAIGIAAYWELLSTGRTATRRITLYDPSPFRSQIAAEVDFDPLAHQLSSRQVRRMDRAAQFGVVCTREAVTDSGLDLETVDPGRIGVSIGSAVGCTVGLETEYAVVSDDGRHWLVDHHYAVPHLYGHMVPSTLTVEVAWEVAAEGPTALISTGCTSGLDAVGHGALLIEEGSADVVIAGATDAPVSPISSAAFDAIKATSTNNADPEHASRPFDRDRDGFVLGEGAAVMVLEESAAAHRRGARVYAEIDGYASRSNAYHMTGLKADGREMAEAIRCAMDRGRIAASDIDYINAHGSGTQQNDRHETAAFKRSLGERAYQVPVSSIKSMIGHSLGAIGALEIAACALALDRQVVPPTANLHNPDPELDLDYVPCVARDHAMDTVLSVGSGFGGFQTALLLSRSSRR
ncbi:beta-ACP synthase [Actinosynnema sp. ALI-1.44]|uniref:beta-ketoacyl-[acyl-carrier-protein] synthase family protein n=1 Tax=Actinosynnema sp. ALI-1.44 TaxID=1933779 RepID=UPI00097C582F|nr:beta-ketoacyl-[acyl-carrier-protein] synthase family protein [Actinosynnema sp. ALI-1.44]ONI77908.1 beta-ACP synthase [Actinosynnema sp. ALI-1.44]